MSHGIVPYRDAEVPAPRHRKGPPPPVECSIDQRIANAERWIFKDAEAHGEEWARAGKVREPRLQVAGVPRRFRAAWLKGYDRATREMRAHSATMAATTAPSDGRNGIARPKSREV